MNKVATLAVLLSLFVFLLLMIGLFAVNVSSGTVAIIVVFILAIIISHHLVKEYAVLEGNHHQ